MKSFAKPFKAYVPKDLDISLGYRSFDKVLVFQIVLLIFLLFLKVYVRCLYINEEKKISQIKYDIKLTRGELSRLKTELNKYVDEERLDQLARAFKKEEEIEVYVVR